MKFFLPIIFLLGISRNVLGKGIRKERSNIEDELYQEFMNMNVSCYPSDSCAENRTDDPPVPYFDGGKCSCHSQCWEYGTCCIDSPHRSKPPIYECLSAGGYYYYYMVNRCPDNTHPDSIWRSQCEREWDETDDILMITPVTSLNSSRIYKNYYCFRCHETTDKYVAWNLKVENYNEEAPEETSVYSVVYNQTEQTWVAIFNESQDSFPVVLYFNFPDNMWGSLREPRQHWTCNQFSMKTDCPRCTNERLRAKCLAYMAVVYTKSHDRYKNVHCALCNDVSIDEILTCDLEPYSKKRVPEGLNYECLMNVNNKRKRRTCFQNENIPETCKGVYEVWNRYSKVCQKISCPEPGYEHKNDICVKP